MFKVKVSSKFRAVLANKLKGTVDSKFIQDMQTEVVDGEIKRLIAAGVSPVDSYEGGRRFRGYKDPKKYPGKQKAKRPVSLYLSGVMLSFYRAVKVSGTRITLGIPTNAPEDVKVRAVANNVGTVSESGKEAIPARRFIPLKGETFRISVLRKIKNLYARRIKDLLSSK
jgi:hypothetical protein